VSSGFDLAVVGAGFAGLALARRAAAAGLRVAVLDRKPEPGAQVHTTGILVAEAAALIDAPPALLRAVGGVRLYAPSLKSIDLRSPGYSFYATDTAGLLRHMAGEAAGAGAQLFYDTPFAGARDSGGTHVLSPGDLRARWIVGADGARSAVAEHFKLGSNRRFLVGIEAEYRGIGGVAADRLHTFLDRSLAPGYIGWVVPGVGVVQVGVAAKRADRPQLAAFTEKIAGLFDLSHAELVERRSGLIPVGGVVAPIAAPRVLLVGDAAGTVSPLTAGGIFTALHFGARAADLLVEHFAGRCEDPAAILAREYPRFAVKRRLRQLLDAGLPDWFVNAMLHTPPLRVAARLVYFHSKGLGSKKAWREILFGAEPDRGLSQRR
jgi:flavin-dependent dehydrogenase